MRESTSSLQDIVRSDIEFIDDGLIGISIDDCPYYDFYVKFDLKLDVAKSTNGVGGETLDYSVDKFSIIEILDCVENQIDKSTIDGYETFKYKLEKILIDCYFES